MNQPRLFAFLAAACLFATAHAQDASEVVERDGSHEEVPQSWSHVGLLRARDLSAFGLSCLDMLPAHTVDAKEGIWTFEVPFAYQTRSS